MEKVGGKKVWCNDSTCSFTGNLSSMVQVFCVTTDRTWQMCQSKFN